jgi:hypothetical protein
MGSRPGTGASTPLPNVNNKNGSNANNNQHQLPPASASASQSSLISSYTASTSSRRGPGHWKGMEEYEGVKVVDGEPPTRVFEGTELLQRMERERLAQLQQQQQAQAQAAAAAAAAAQQSTNHGTHQQLNASASTITLASTATLSSGASMASLRATPAGLRTGASTPSSVGPPPSSSMAMAHHHVRETPPPRMHHIGGGKEYYQPPTALAAAARVQQHQPSTAGGSHHVTRRRVVPARGVPPPLIPIGATIIPPATAPQRSISTATTATIGVSSASSSTSSSISTASTPMLPVLSTPSRNNSTPLASPPVAQSSSTSARMSPRSIQTIQRRHAASPVANSSNPSPPPQPPSYYEQPQPIPVTPTRGVGGNVYQQRAGGSAPYPTTSSSTFIPHQRSASTTVPAMPILPSTPRRSPLVTRLPIAEY